MNDPVEVENRYYYQPFSAGVLPPVCCYKLCMLIEQIYSDNKPFVLRSVLMRFIDLWMPINTIRLPTTSNKTNPQVNWIAQ